MGNSHLKRISPYNVANHMQIEAWNSVAHQIDFNLEIDLVPRSIKCGNDASYEDVAIFLKKFSFLKSCDRFRVHKSGPKLGTVNLQKLDLSIMTLIEQADLIEARGARNYEMMQGINKISIANPETAPYGAAAIKALESTGRMGTVRKKLVFAQNVVQAFQYAHTESVDAGFCALSSVFSEQGKMGCYFLLEHAPVIIQRGCVLKGSKNRKLAEQFAAFLCSQDAQNIKTKFGYN